MLIEKLDSISQGLDTIVENIVVGIQTSADKIYILEYRGEIGNLVRAYSRAADEVIEVEKELFRPIVSGKHVARFWPPETDELLLFPYYLTEDGAVLIPFSDLELYFPLTCNYLLRFSGELRNRENGKMDHDAWYAYVYPKNLDKQEHSKLGCARLTERLSFFGDFEGELFLDNVDVNGVLLDSESDYSGKYLMAILNSKLIDWRFRKGSVPFRGNFFSANKQFISQLPIRRIAFGLPNTDKNSVVETAKAAYKNEDFNTFLETGHSEFLHGHGEVIHDLLSYLADQMISMNSSRQLLKKRFYTDLEGVVGDEEQFFNLRNKTKWQSTLYKNVSAARPYVDSESRSTVSLDESLGWDEEAFKGFVKQLAGRVRGLYELVAVYNNYAPIYRDLCDRIQGTDDLIDQIVYKLYGLAEEEIAIVEGLL